MKKITLFCFTLLLTVGSALSQQVDFTADHDADFSKFRTYKWVATQNVGAIDYLTSEQIKAAVDTALAQKGLKKVDSDTADLLMTTSPVRLLHRKFPRIRAAVAHQRSTMVTWLSTCTPLPTTRSGEQIPGSQGQSGEASKEPEQSCCEAYEELSAT